ncbi:glycosyltransferase family 2 protein [Flavobacterium gawalongense]|nr:glycosyltransferase family A protein [Flavobacterium gawalongense]
MVPCYNQAQYLDECLQSVLDQIYPNWECIIVNDGSLDDTEAIAQEWIHKDNRFIYLKKENGGLSSARNYGISYAKGEFILPLDADDKIASHYVALALKEFENNSDTKVVYCQAEKFGEEFGIWQLSPFFILNLARRNMIFCSAMYRKKDWELVGGYDINLIYGLEDWEFWIAILKNGGDVKCLDEVGFYYRIREKSMARIINLEERNFSERYVAKKHIDFFLSNYDELLGINGELNSKLKSEKVLLNELCFQLFGFKIFNLKK